MNPRLDFIFGRRSIREYAPRDIPASVVRDLLEAGMAAPSAVARDPWRFVVVRDRAMLSAIAQALPNGAMLASAGLGIVVAGELSQAHDRQLSYMLQDCSACVENVLLAAHALGLGACWLGVHPREERIARLRRLLGIPDSVVPVCVVSIGWPAETKESRTRYDAAKVHEERW